MQVLFNVRTTGKPPSATPSVTSGYPPGGAAAAAATAALMDPATSAYYAALYSQQMYGAAGLSPYAAAGLALVFVASLGIRSHYHRLFLRSLFRLF